MRKVNPLKIQFNRHCLRIEVIHLLNCKIVLLIPASDQHPGQGSRMGFIYQIFWSSPHPSRGGQDKVRIGGVPLRMPSGAL